jgi:GNAT superfamily N-acetyltransferase
VSLTLRPATLADAPALAELITELGYPTTADGMTIRFSKILHHADYQTFVIEKSEELLGMVGLVQGLTWETTGTHIRIIALVVSASARGQGLADRLIEAAETWARAQGAMGLSLNCGNRPERAAAHQFYPRMGFVASSTGYRKTL